MQPTAARLLTLVASLVLMGSVVHVDIVAQESTPVASPTAGGSGTPPALGAPIALSAAVCDPAAFPAGATGITYQPQLDYGFVVPEDAPDYNLYLTINTLPVGSCLLFERGTFGASTYYVLEGTVEFIAWGGNTTAGNAGGAIVHVPLGAPVTLNAGDWVTIERATEAYAYRNPGREEGTIIMAVYEKRGPRPGCVSGCRRQP